MNSTTANRGTLLANVVDFGLQLRQRGLLVTPSEAIDSLRALRHIDISDRDEFYLSLRTVMTSRIEDIPIFDEVFFSFWPAIPKRRRGTKARSRWTSCHRPRARPRTRAAKAARSASRRRSRPPTKVKARVRTRRKWPAT